MEGNNNTAVGYRALSNTSYNGGFPLHNNCAYGSYALGKHDEGNGNVAIGDSAQAGNRYGNYNTSIGFHSLNNSYYGNWNTCIGDQTDVSTIGLNGACALGSSAISNATNKIVIGASGVGGMVIGGYQPWSNLSDGRFKNNVKEDVPGLEFINQLRPVTYTVDVNKLNHHITAQMPDSIARKYYPSEKDIAIADKKIQTGFIAQEVEATAKEIGYDFDGVNAPQNPTDNYSIAYSQFVPSIVKGMQELNEEVESLKLKVTNANTANEKLMQENIEIKNQLQKVQQCLNILCEKNDREINSHTNSTAQINIAPNPTNDIAYITVSNVSDAQNLEIKIIDAAGKLLRTFSTSNNTTVEVDTQLLSKGTYTVQLVSESKILKTEKLINH